MRGGWAEVSLGNLLEQVFTPEQYDKNVAVDPQSDERVEFAIKLPGQGDHDSHCWLPIDAKFPLRITNDSFKRRNGQMRTVLRLL